MGVSPYCFCAEAKKWQDPHSLGFASSTIVILIACHIHIGLEPGDLRGLPLKIAIEVYYVKSMG